MTEYGRFTSTGPVAGIQVKEGPVGLIVSDSVTDALMPLESFTVICTLEAPWLLTAGVPLKTPPGLIAKFGGNPVADHV